MLDRRRWLIFKSVRFAFIRQLLQRLLLICVCMLHVSAGSKKYQRLIFNLTHPDKGFHIKMSSW